MADYANSTDLGYLITPIANDVSANLKAYAIEVSTTWVNAKVGHTITGTVPDPVEKAATYYAYVFLLKNLYDTTGDESPMMDWYEKQANELLGMYVESIATEDSAMHPYSGSLTPTEHFMGRHLRTMTDDDSGEYDNVDEDEWEAEE